MELVQFSVTNYRSITSANKIAIHDITVLVGKNNEGKSNFLNALNVAMLAVIDYIKPDGANIFRHRGAYEWETDFPVQIQDRTSGTESRFRLDFRLNEQEKYDFHNLTGIRGNEDIPIEIKIGKDNIPKIDVPKRGSSSYKDKAKEIAGFISKRISINYIQAVRTEGMAIRALEAAIYSELDALKENEEYAEAKRTIDHLEDCVLEDLSKKLVDPLKTFIPSLQDVSITREDRFFPLQRYRNDFDVLINDGITTSIKSKGDGIKSLVALAILQDKKTEGSASVVAIEEPESHLHPGAMHSLVDVINKMAENSQVIISTHNPLFISQNRIGSNIIVDQGTVRAAKNISEIRTILGVLPSDNLQNARFVLVVEGEDDKISLEKILPLYSDSIKNALKNNSLVIKPLGGASNLAHDLLDLKNNLCQYVVLLDNDNAGKNAANKAKEKGLLKDNQLRYTICNGLPEAEFEDCIKPVIYSETIKEKYGVDIKKRGSRKKKWSDRMRDIFLSQGASWSEQTESNVKELVANSIPRNAKTKDSILIAEKATFLEGLVTITETMISKN